MSQFVDYTKWSTQRKSLHRLPIATCPKCGRNGEHTHRLVNGRRVDEYTHTAEIVDGSGVRFFDVKDRCWVYAPVPDNRKEELQELRNKISALEAEQDRLDGQGYGGTESEGFKLYLEKSRSVQEELKKLQAAEHEIYGSLLEDGGRP